MIEKIKLLIIAIDAPYASMTDSLLNALKPAVLYR